MELIDLQIWFLYLCLIVLLLCVFFVGYNFGSFTAYQMSYVQMAKPETQRKYLIGGGISGVLFLIIVMTLTFITI